MDCFESMQNLHQVGACGTDSKTIFGFKNGFCMKKLWLLKVTQKKGLTSQMMTSARHQESNQHADMEAIWSTW